MPGAAQVLNPQTFDPVEKVTSQLAVEVTHGIMIEALKSFIFSK